MRGNVGRGGGGERRGGLRDRGSLASWHHAGLEHRRTPLDPGAWYSTVREGGYRFMAAWVKEEEKASEHRQRNREAEEADKDEVAPGVTVVSLRRVGWTNPRTP